MAQLQSRLGRVTCETGSSQCCAAGLKSSSPPFFFFFREKYRFKDTTLICESFSLTKLLMVLKGVKTPAFTSVHLDTFKHILLIFGGVGKPSFQIAFKQIFKICEPAKQTV